MNAFWTRMTRFFRRLTVWRLRSARAVRQHYMLGFTATALALATAAGLGVLDRAEAPETAAVTTARPTIATVSPPNRAVQGPTLVLTYYIVGSEQERIYFNSLQDQLVNRDWLRRSSFEVVVAGTPEEEAAALGAIAEARKRAVVGEFLVVDLRGSAVRSE